MVQGQGGEVDGGGCKAGEFDGVGGHAGTSGVVVGDGNGRDSSGSVYLLGSSCLLPMPPSGGRGSTGILPLMTNLTITSGGDSTIYDLGWGRWEVPILPEEVRDNWST